MLKLTEQQLAKLESQHSGITDTIQHFENVELPACPHCQSKDTAIVSCGIVGRSISVAAATTKMKLLPNLPKPGEYFCNGCKKFFS